MLHDLCCVRISLTRVNWNGIWGVFWGRFRCPWIINHKTPKQDDEYDLEKGKEYIGLKKFHNNEKNHLDYLKGYENGHMKGPPPLIDVYGHGEA